MTRHRWIPVAAGVVDLVPACLALLAAVGDVPTWARDADCDGHVSMGEWQDLGIDHGWRPAVGGPSDCMEVFRFKDGLSVVLRCKSEPGCRLGVTGS